MKKIVITGLAIVSPIGIGKSAFWESLEQGRDGFGPITHFDPAALPCRIAAQVKNFNDAGQHIDKKKARRLDRFTQFAVAAAVEALKDAGLDAAGLPKESAGVIIGSGNGGMNTIEEQHGILMNKGQHHLSPFGIPMTISNAAAAEVAMTSDWRDRATRSPRPAQPLPMRFAPPSRIFFLATRK